jgi:glycosyltransferase involved in cell wall biosynthesis
LMIDIIIPAYNSHRTIVATLRSIAVQVVSSLVKVTIVNDGGDGYSSIISQFPDLRIEEITTENGGPAIARQVALDRTSLPFVVFIDSDDVFTSIFSVGEIYAEISKSEDIVCVNSKFIVEGEDGSYDVPAAREFIWLFGNIYRRDFISSNDIRFPTISSNEDMLFNLEIAIRSMQQGKRVVYIERPTYLWRYNPGSITRRNDYEYSYYESPYHVIKGKTRLFRRFGREDVSERIVESLWDFFYFWEESVLNRMTRSDYHNSIMEAIREYYSEFKEVIDSVEDDRWRQIGIEKKKAMNYLSRFSFPSFVQMMKSGFEG